MKKFLLLFPLFLGTAEGASNTLYNPSTYPLDGSRVIGDGQGVSATCSALNTTNLDLTLTTDEIITGAQLIVNGASLGDWIELRVMSGGVTVAQPLPGPWYLSQTDTSDFRFEFPIKAASGLTLRATVHTTVLLVTPYVAINWKLWKVNSGF